VAEWLEDGRLMKLVEPFGYHDPNGVFWDAPAGATIDGASIPEALQALIGGPFNGRYRNASVIHDWYCDVRTRPWRAVHRVFYDAMLTSGVSKARAKLMYGGVYFGGPRWTDVVVSNMDLARNKYFEDMRRPFGPDHYPWPDGEDDGPYADIKGMSYVTTVVSHAFDTSRLEELESYISEYDPDLHRLETWADKRLAQSNPNILLKSIRPL
jgi:hypothetical protein